MRLADHVRQVLDAVVAAPGEVLLVSHSYSALVTGQVADQVPDRVSGLVHFAGFLPTDGRSLLDGWGSSQDDRDQEVRDIEQAGNLWLPPTRPMLDMEPSLSGADRDFVASRFTPHPGFTVTDPARMSSPVGHQHTTYVALSVESEQQAWEAAPAAARAAKSWRRKYIRSGHWPMLSQHDEVVNILVEQAQLHQ